MIRLSRSLQAWGKPDFNAVFKQDIEALDTRELPLQHIVSANGSERPLSAIVIGAAENADSRIVAKAGVYYPALVGFSHCDDDTGPVDEQNEYAELQFDIDKTTGEAAVTLVGERMEVGCE